MNVRNRFRRSWIILSACGILLAAMISPGAAALEVVTPAPQYVWPDLKFASNGPVLSSSHDWSGWVEVHYPTGAPITQASASWDVPTAAAGATASATMVGIGGYTDATLIAAGTEQDGSGAYYAWYETFPGAQVNVLPVSPGDQVAVDVYSVGTNLWGISITDATAAGVTKATWSPAAPIGYTDSENSAEWVVADPSSTTAGTLPRWLPLANFNRVHMVNVIFTGNSVAAAPAIWWENAGAVIQANSSAVPQTDVSPYALQTGSAFGSMFWIRYAPW